MPDVKADSSEPPASSSESESESDTEHGDNQPKSVKPKISEALSQLGIYAHSVKPRKNWPLHVLINISESAIDALVPTSAQDLIENGNNHLRRVYPRGTRIASGNLDPLKLWRVGSHFVALNWQEFDRGMQLNEALFAGTTGWVAKPPVLLGRQIANRKIKLSLSIIGLSALPKPTEDDEFSLRIRVHLLHSSGEQTWKSKSIRIKNVSASEVHVMFEDSTEWIIEEDPFAFLRIIVVRDERLERDPHLACFCGCIPYMQHGFRFLRLLDTKGKDTHATLLVRTGLTEL